MRELMDVDLKSCCPRCSWSSGPREPGWPRRATLPPPCVHLYDLGPETADDSQHIRILSPTASLSVRPRRRRLTSLPLTAWPQNTNDHNFPQPDFQGHKAWDTASPLMSQHAGTCWVCSDNIFAFGFTIACDALWASSPA